MGFFTQSFIRELKTDTPWKVSRRILWRIRSREEKRAHIRNINMVWRMLEESRWQMAQPAMGVPWMLSHSPKSGQVLWKLWEWANMRLILSYRLDRKCSCSVLVSFIVPRWQATACESEKWWSRGGYKQVDEWQHSVSREGFFILSGIPAHIQREKHEKNILNCFPTLLACILLPLLGWSCEQKNPLRKETSLKTGKPFESTEMCQRRKYTGKHAMSWQVTHVVSLRFEMLSYINS